MDCPHFHRRQMSAFSAKESLDRFRWIINTTFEVPRWCCIDPSNAPDLPGLFSERRRDYSPCEEFQIGGALRCDCPSISPASKLAAGPMCTTNARGATSRNFSGKACSQTWAETVVVSCRRGIVLHPDDGTRPGGYSDTRTSQHTHCLDSRRALLLHPVLALRTLRLLPRRTLLPRLQPSFGLRLCGLRPTDRLADSCQQLHFRRIAARHPPAPDTRQRTRSRPHRLHRARTRRPPLGHPSRLPVRARRPGHSRKRDASDHDSARTTLLDGNGLRSAFSNEPQSTQASIVVRRPSRLRPAQQAFHRIFSRRSRRWPGAFPGAPRVHL